jgi:ubiquinone/menaquinone biosynthesis C-methylase UbiE
VKETVYGFRKVDQAADAQYFIRFLDDLAALDSVRECRRLMIDRLDLRAGHRVLDVGCGVGDDVAAIARLVGPSGKVVGVDSSQVMVDEARKRCKGLPAEIVVGDAENLQFAPGSFDAARSERTFMYLDAGRALDEMIRVVKPGGTVVVFDLDHDSISIDSPEKETTRKVIHFLSDNHRNGSVGRQLKRLFKERGLTDLTLRPHSHVLGFPMFERVFGGLLIKAQDAGVIGTGEAARWYDGFVEANRLGYFHMTVPGFIVAGRKT